MNNLITINPNHPSKNNDKNLRAVTEGAVSPILKAECYVLNNGLTVIQGRGYIRSLTGEEEDRKQSGQRMERMIKNKGLHGIIPEEVVKKLTTKILFETKAGKLTEGLDATTLPRLAIALWEAYLTGKIKEGHTYFKEAQNAGNIVKAFGDMGITGHIHQITGYQQIQGILEIIKYFDEKYVRDLPSKHKRQFEELGFFDGLYKIYNIKRNQLKPWQHPQFFGHIFNKYIYIPLDVIMTNGQIQTRGIMKKLLAAKKSSGSTLYSFIEETGETKFFGHLGTLTNLTKIANGPKHFEQLFYQFFPDCNPNKNQLPLFPDDFISIAKLDMKKLIVEQASKQTPEEEKEHNKIIKNIQKDFPKLETKDFENKLEKAASSKRKK